MRRGTVAIVRRLGRAVRRKAAEAECVSGTPARTSVRVALRRGGAAAPAPVSARRAKSGLGESHGFSQQLISLDHLAQAALVGTVAAVFVRMIAAHEAGICLPELMAVRLLAEAEHR